MAEKLLHPRLRAIALPGGRSFASIAPAFGERFVEDLERSYIVAFQAHAVSSNAARTSPFLKFLNWLAVSQDPRALALFSQLRDDRKGATRAQLRGALIAWRDIIGDLENCSLVSTRRPKTRETVIEAVMSAVSGLARAKYWPHPGAFKKPTFPTDDDRHAPSLGEIDRPGDAKINDPRQVVERNATRLRILRDAAAVFFEAEHAAYTRGRDLAAGLSMDLPEDDAEFASLLKEAALGAQAPLSAGDPAGARCIAMIRKHSWLYRGGRIAPKHDAYRIILARLGGSDHVRRFVIPSRLAMIACQTIVLVDSGINIGPCEELPEDCFEAEIVKGCMRLVRISGVKDRAAGAVVSAALIDDVEPLPIRDDRWDLSAVKAIEYWRDMSREIRLVERERGTPGTELLWMVARKHDFGVLNLTAGTAAFPIAFADLRRLLQTVPELQGLVFSRRNVRTSYLQHRHAANNYRSTIARLFADHRSLRSMKNYISRSWMRRAYASMIREFQTLLEAILTQEIEGVSEADLPGPETLSERREKGRETGLGFICLQPVVESRRPANTCVQVEHCAACPQRSFRPTPGSLRDLVRFHASLKAAEPAFQQRNPSRWAAVWLPYLALVEAALELLEQSHWRFRLKGARIEVAESLRAGRTALLRPW